MTKYRLSRLNRGLQTRHTRNRSILRAAKWATAILATGFAVLAVANTQIISRALATEAEVRHHVESVVISCLAHGAAYFDGELTACKPVNTKFRKEQKHLEDVK